MENSSKAPLNSHVSLFADKMPALIDQWRSEISKNKNYRPQIDPQQLKSFLEKSETHGVPATLVALTVLSCEWVFRVRRATDEDIERELFEMRSNLSKSMHAALSRFQAHLLIKLLESNLKKELRKIRIPIIFGFESSGMDPDWFFVQPAEIRNPKRTAPKQIVPNKRGRPPILGPILAGVIVGGILEGKLGKDGLKMGQELCQILLKRKVLVHEYRHWRKVVDNLSDSGDGLRHHFSKRLQGAHHQTFEMQGEAISPERFLEKCETEPKSVLWWLAQENLLEIVYSAKWSSSKTHKKRRT
jgi:hypothetical protein